MKHLQNLGISALGSRLRRLGDKLIEDCARIYEQGKVPFEPRWFPLVRVLSDRGPATITEAALQLGVTHASVSQIVTAMEGKDLIKRTVNRTDRRQVLLALTPKGETLVAELSEYWTDIRGAVQLMTRGFEKELLVVLEKLEKAYLNQDLVQAFRATRVNRYLNDASFEPFSRSPQDKKDFHRLNMEFLNEFGFKLEAFDRRVFKDPYKEVIGPGGEIHFLNLGKKRVGCFALIALPEEPTTFELAKMAVSGPWRAWGLGKKMLKFAEERAKKLGATRLVLATSTKLVAARRLYEKNDYVVMKPNGEIHYDRVDLYMEKSLKGGR